MATLSFREVGWTTIGSRLATNWLGSVLAGDGESIAMVFSKQSRNLRDCRTFVISYALMFIIDKIPVRHQLMNCRYKLICLQGCHFRSTTEEEIVGVDEADLGECMPTFVYVSAIY